MTDKTYRLGITLALAIALVASVLTPSLSRGQEENLVLKMNLIPSKVEAGKASHQIGYVNLETGDGEPAIASNDVTVELISSNSTIASVPSSVVVPAGSEYAKFDVTVSDLVGVTEISALLGNQIITSDFRVVEAVGLIPEDIDLVINTPATEMQLGAEMPISIYFESDGEILQAPRDITISFDYERSLIKLSPSSVVIKKGSYYSLVTVRALEKTGNAFVKASISDPPLNTVENIEVSSSLPSTFDIQVFPERVGLGEKTIDIFVSLLDPAGNPTVAPEDTKFELFSSSSRLSSLGEVDAVIKKGEFGFYYRHSIFFPTEQEDIIIGASSSGLGAATDTFEIVREALELSHPAAQDRIVSVFTIAQVPSDSGSIVVYQLNAVETDDDDVIADDDGIFDQDLDDDDEFDDFRDRNNDGVIDEDDEHPIDEFDDGELYPIQSDTLYSSSQGNINVVSGDNSIVKILDSGTIGPGRSYGTAMISAERQSGSLEVSVSLQDVGSGTGPITVVGGLSATQSQIFSPVGAGLEGNNRIVFNENGFSDLFILTMDGTGRPAASQDGEKYLIKPINNVVEIAAGKSFVNIPIYTDSFGTALEEGASTITAIPVGVNPNPDLEVQTDFLLIAATGTSATVTFPLKTIFGFSGTNPIGTVQLNNQFGSPVVATNDMTISLSSSSPGTVRVPSSVIIPQGKSFTGFALTMTGRGGNVTITAESDGVRSSTADIEVVLAKIEGEFVDLPGSLIATETGSLTINAPEGTNVLWGIPSSFEVVSKDEKATTYDPDTDSYSANLQVIPKRAGNFTIDVTLLKDGFESKTISTPLIVEPFLATLNAFIEYSGATVPYNRPTNIAVSVQDSEGEPVENAVVAINPGANATADPAFVITDDSGSGSFDYVVTDTKSFKKTLTIVASKDGYRDSQVAQEFEITDVPTALPPWITYVVIAGVVGSVGAGVVYFMKKPKGKRFEEGTEEEEEEEI